MENLGSKGGFVFSFHHFFSRFGVSIQIPPVQGAPATGWRACRQGWHFGPGSPTELKCDNPCLCCRRSLSHPAFRLKASVKFVRLWSVRHVFTPVMFFFFSVVGVLSFLITSPFPLLTFSLPPTFFHPTHSFLLHICPSIIHRKSAGLLSWDHRFFAAHTRRSLLYYSCVH